MNLEYELKTLSVFENIKAVIRRRIQFTRQYDKVDMKTTQIEILKMKCKNLNWWVLSPISHNY